MKLRFYKYQGTGNDFIMLDNREGQISLTKEQIVRLCDRKFGVGSDGVILIEKSDDTLFYMNFFNPDGSQSFCGNGSRCAVNFAKELGIHGNTKAFTAIDGIHEFDFSDDVVKIKMKDVNQVKQLGSDFVLHTGSPHFVKYVSDPSDIDIINEARKIRYSDDFKAEGINVNFVSENKDHITMRTYERGVEDETLSCGTGVTAAALSYALRHPGTSRVDVITRGGKLEVRMNSCGARQFTDIWLCGPAAFVYSGVIEIA